MVSRADSHRLPTSRTDHFPAFEDEREEEGGKDESGNPRDIASSGSPSDAPLSSAVIAISNRRVRGLELGARVPILRC
jgi:hypothetical protein